MRTEKISEHDAILLFATNSPARPWNCISTGRPAYLLRQLRFGSSPLGLTPTRIDYGDYKAFDGVQVPLHLVITRLIERWTSACCKSGRKSP